MTVLELEVIKETPQKRITLVRELDKRTIYIKKELKAYNKEVWKTLNELDLQGIPHIYSLKENEEELEIIEEYISCNTLEDCLKERCFSHEEAYQITRQLCVILDVLHKQTPPIIHRDIKPENIFYDGKHVYLFDFDIARNYHENQKRDTTVLGSQGYAAPEQFGFYQTDARSDIYSLGVLYHVLLTNNLPRECNYHGFEKNVIDKMISIDPHKRYQDMQEIIRRLDQLFYQNKLIERKEQNYCLPGFRSHKIWKMILAVMGYGLAIELVSTFKIEGQATELDYFVYRMILILWFVITLVLSTNYLSLRDYLPYYKGQKTLIKVISTIVSWFVLMLGVLLVGTFFIALFK